MLDYFRKRAQSKLVVVLFGLIALTFIFGFGVLPNVGNDDPGSPNNVVVQIGDRTIVYESVQQLASRYEERMGGDIEPQMRDYLRSQALQTLVSRELMTVAAWSEGIRVTDEEVVKAISELPAFQRDGAFVPELYHAQLRRMRVRASDYEMDTRRDLEIQRLQSLLLAGVNVSDAEVEERYRLENDRLDIISLRFDPDALETEIPAPTEEELAAFHAANPDRFEAPETVSAAVATVDPKALEATLEITEAQLIDRYDRDPKRWERDENVEARHILIKARETADESESAIALSRIEAIQLELDEGAEFETLARERSEDTGSAIRGGSLGSFERDQMVAPFADAAFGAEVGEIVGPVRTTFGYHLIEVLEHRLAGTQPLEEVRESLLAELRRETSTEQAEARAQDLVNAVSEGATLEEAALELDIAVDLAGPTRRDESLAGSGRLTSRAFEMVPEEVSEPIRTVRGFAVLQLRERTPARPLDLEEAHADVQVALMGERAMQQVRERAEQALEKLRAGASPEATAEELGADLDRTGPFPLTSRMLPGLGGDETVVAAALSLSEARPVADAVVESGGKLLVLAFGALTGGEMDDATAVDAVRQRMLREREQLAMGELLEQLNERTPPRYNEEALAFLTGQP